MLLLFPLLALATPMQAEGHVIKGAFGVMFGEDAGDMTVKRWEQSGPGGYWSGKGDGFFEQSSVMMLRGRNWPMHITGTKYYRAGALPDQVKACANGMAILRAKIRAKYPTLRLSPREPANPQLDRIFGRQVKITYEEPGADRQDARQISIHCTEAYVSRDGLDIPTQLTISYDISSNEFRDHTYWLRQRGG